MYSKLSINKGYFTLFIILSITPRRERQSSTLWGSQKGLMNRTPAMNPPTCAQKATPPEAEPNVKKPPKSCRMNQYPSMKNAGTTIRVKKNPKNISI